MSEIHAGDTNTVIHSRHEQGAVAMADGFARHTKDIGVCIIGQGPGIGQAGSALTTARKRGSNLLVIVPETSRAASVDNPTTYTSPSASVEAKDFDQTAYLKSTIGSVESIRSPDTVIPVFKKVFRNLRLGQGSIAIQISRDILNGPINIPHELEEKLTTAVEVHDDSPSTVLSSPDKINEAIERLLDSDATKHPIIIVGNGAARRENKEEIKQLAERMGALIATTFRGKGYLSEHPFYLGAIGKTGNYLANEYTNQASYVLALGCGLNAHTQDNGRLFADDAELVQVDIHRSALGRYGPISLGIQGDALATVKQFNKSLDEYEINRSEQMWTTEVETRIQEFEPYNESIFDNVPERIDPRLLVSKLNTILPDDRVVITDGGQHAKWVYEAIDIHKPDHLICRGDFSTVGLALPMGIGVGVGSNQATPVVFCGDGGFMMQLQEISTARRYEIPVIVIVLNDDALGAEYHRLSNDSQDIGRTATPNLAEVASALGAETHRVTNQEELDAMASALETPIKGPVVMECLVDRNVVHPSFD